MKGVIYRPLKPRIALGLPHDPQFEDVCLPATLQRLVPGVVRDIVELVLLEQVARPRAVTILQKILKNTIKSLADNYM